jgi:putative membrane protein
MPIMLLDATLAIVHHLAVFSLAAALAAQAAILSMPLQASRLRALGRIDGLYGLAAVIALSAGLSRAIFGSKGWAFYSANPLFWSKLGLFILIGLISIVPTVRFFRWRKAGTDVSEPQRVNTRTLVAAQLIALFALPVLAALMARGIGHGV